MRLSNIQLAVILAMLAPQVIFLAAMLGGEFYGLCTGLSLFCGAMVFILSQMEH